jgi:hypothetical protein
LKEHLVETHVLSNHKTLELLFQEGQMGSRKPSSSTSCSCSASQPPCAVFSEKWTTATPGLWPPALTGCGQCTPASTGPSPLPPPRRSAWLPPSRLQLPPRGSPVTAGRAAAPQERPAAPPRPAP